MVKQYITHTRNMCATIDTRRQYELLIHMYLKVLRKSFNIWLIHTNQRAKTPKKQKTNITLESLYTRYQLK